MKKSFIILFLIITAVAFAQEEVTYKKGDTIYYNKWYEITDREAATRLAIMGDITTKEEKKLYQLAFFSLDTLTNNFVKVEDMYSKSYKKIYREEKNVIFWDNGQKKEEGKRKKDDRIGVWSKWYKDGTKMAEYEYFELEETSDEKQKRSHLLNFWNRKGQRVIKDGTGNYFLKDEDGDEVLGTMLNYNKVGVWQGFKKNGRKLYQETYKEGELEQGESWDEKGNKYTYNVFFEKPEFIGGQPALAKVIKENFKVPKYALRRGIEGWMLVYFEVNAEGKVQKIEMRRKLCEPCDQEAIRIVKLLKDWKPGKRRGQNIAVKHSLPLRIKLN